MHEGVFLTRFIGHNRQLTCEVQKSDVVRLKEGRERTEIIAPKRDVSEGRPVIVAIGFPVVRQFNQSIGSARAIAHRNCSELGIRIGFTTRFHHPEQIAINGNRCHQLANTQHGQKQSTWGDAFGNRQLLCPQCVMDVWQVSVARMRVIDLAADLPRAIDFVENEEICEPIATPVHEFDLGGRRRA